MKLVVDIGNTDVVIGLNENGSWIQNWRTPSRIDLPVIEYDAWLRSNFLEAELVSTDVDSVVISSVVPDLTQKLAEAINHVTTIEPIIVNAEVIEKLNLGPNVKPHQIGSDLVANAVSAYDRFHGNAIVVDFGTALTFTSIDEKGEVMGVAIAPGVRTSMKSLSSNTAKLPEIPLEIPDHYFGTNTIAAMQSGIMQGYVGLVRHMVSETKKQHSHEPKVIATGGLSFVFKPLHDVFDEIDRDLTLNGLLVIGEKNKN
ncbi:MAG: type III pantothenate kinase [Reichenbachiella sp.]